MNIAFIGMACALGLSAMGSAFGSGFAAQASVGAWKKCYANGKPAPFIMVAFSGAPLTQTIYGFLLMNFIHAKCMHLTRLLQYAFIFCHLPAYILIDFSFFHK